MNKWERDDDRPPEAHWSTAVDVYRAWRMPGRESVHLNWTPHYVVDYQFSNDPDLGNSFRCLEWESSWVDGDGSIMLENFDEYWDNVDPLQKAGAPVNFDAPDLQTYRRSTLHELQPHWLVVMKVVVIHSSLELVAGTGLFGLLGDAPVQVIDVHEEDKVEAYYRLAEECERKTLITYPQDFTRESASKLQEKMITYIAEQMQILPTTMRAAIMFRHCAQMCNHVGEECLEGSHRKKKRYCECAKCELRRNVIGLADDTGERLDLDALEAIERGNIKELVVNFSQNEPEI